MIHNEAVAAWRNNEGVGAKKEEISGIRADNTNINIREAVLPSDGVSDAKSEAKLQFLRRCPPPVRTSCLTG